MAASSRPVTIRMRVDDNQPDAKLTPFQKQYGLHGVMCRRPGCPNPNPDRYGPAGHPWCLSCRPDVAERAPVRGDAA